ncbi:nickel-dependent lactate racemase [Blastopirellula sp. J2-11]|uniref:nickel-dependent lactate racemase n=1 Tax=Blastopirellula sp. J2-11 TaxID=2943192 RepID=UPI0021C8FB3D|nr:nickel-dependent lactate racemase [Blastopirellula sp. J2-11]UUO04726.1 nickel-dependent lactate racemase [Blastopirellula sp. J2-11]
MQFPKLFRLRQTFPRPLVTDVIGEVDRQLTMLELSEKVKPGETVAITAGSRGIANIKEIIKAIVDHLKQIGAKPFIVPAMGSHGGGTAEGQIGVLASYGITPEYCGCEIRASMETIVVCQAKEGFPVHFDKHASQADHVVVCGRVKAHTDFTGEIQSGLMKMMLIGLGKHNGAKVYHKAIMDNSFTQIVQSVAREVLSQCNILCGLAIIENGYDETGHIIGVPANEIEQREPELLRLANSLLPKLPFEEADVLIVDEIGKNISGAGMDTNIVGRKFNDHAATGDETPRVKRIVLRGLTEETHGNASGIGMCEFCLTRMVEQMDRNITNINSITSGHVTAAMIPIHYDTDREILENALQTIGLRPPHEARIMWIPHTLAIDEVVCSEAYLAEVKSRSELEALFQPLEMPLDSAGMLPSVTKWLP